MCQLKTSEHVANFIGCGIVDGWRVGAFIDNARFGVVLFVNDDCDSAYDAGACGSLHCDGA